MLPARASHGGRVDVVVPFAGDAGEARLLAAALAALELGEGDTLTVVDNTPSALLRGGPVDALPSVRLARASGERSSYHARNVGALSAGGEWLLFVDADCVPSPTLIADHLDAVERATATGRDAEGIGIVAGAVGPLPGQSSPAARYAASRGHIGERDHVAADLPAGVTANLFVRRAAFEQLGGFVEGVRSGADIEFCIRAQQRGWRLIHAPRAAVAHRHPESVSAMLAKTRRHGAGRRWVNERSPGALPRPRILRPYVRAPAAAILLALSGRGERARFKLLDIRHSTALLRGYWLDDNRASPWPGAD